MNRRYNVLVPLLHVVFVSDRRVHDVLAGRKEGQ